MAEQVFDMHPLFEDVQLQKVFEDAKTFVDCTPRREAAAILHDYGVQKNLPGFDLKKFVLDNFQLPHVFASGYLPDQNKSATDHINHLWDVLTREPDEAGGSLIPLPYPYIVPGGRFGEVYYWDSYFTMLGLQATGRYDMLTNMLANFEHLILTIGFIPNGNRTYYLGRSQPPFFSLMVQLLVNKEGPSVLNRYLPALQKEYDYWMKGADQLSSDHPALYHVVRMPDGTVLNRYCDAFDTARPESYREDVELSHQSPQDPAALYRHLRAGAESGWDYSSRWFKDGIHFSAIHTADIVPVDLNALLYHHECLLAKAYKQIGAEQQATYYITAAAKRKTAIQKYCWNEAAGFYTDYDFVAGALKQELTLAASCALFCEIATASQAAAVADMLERKFLKAGGVVTTLKHTGQQWDAPNGWAPLQWMTVCGLDHYGHHQLAGEIAGRWLQLNTKVYARTGKMMEKYNVEDTSLEAGGGEYAGQDGFGWTNGVFLAMQQRYSL